MPYIISRAEGARKIFDHILDINEKLIGAAVEFF